MKYQPLMNSFAEMQNMPRRLVLVGAFYFMITDFSQTKFFCSAIGYIMSDGKSKTPKQLYEDACIKLQEEEIKYSAMDARQQGMAKGLAKAELIAKLKQELEVLHAGKDNEPLSDGCKGYLSRYYGFVKYGKFNVSSGSNEEPDGLANGKCCEQDSIELLRKVDNEPYLKNDSVMTNDYLRGVPDVFRSYKGEPVSVIDIKTPVDIGSFFSNLNKPLRDLYWWQMQAYLALTGLTIGEVCYCLVDPPQSYIDKQVEKMDAKVEISERLFNLTYSDIPAEERVIRFVVLRDEDAIKRMYSKIETCRVHLSLLQNEHLKINNNG